MYVSSLIQYVYGSRLGVPETRIRVFQCCSHLSGIDRVEAAQIGTSRFGKKLLALVCWERGDKRKVAKAR